MEGRHGGNVPGLNRKVESVGNLGHENGAKKKIRNAEKLRSTL